MLLSLLPGFWISQCFEEQETRVNRTKRGLIQVSEKRPGEKRGYFKEPKTTRSVPGISSSLPPVQSALQIETLHPVRASQA